MKRLLLAVVAVLAVAGCGSNPVAGAPVGEDTTASTQTTTTETTTTNKTTETTTTADKPSLTAPPTAIDENAPAQYCDGTITGALGKEMQVVVIETPAGRVTCDQAGAVLADYYAGRPNPDPTSDPIEVDGYACDQVPEPAMPQVICADGKSLFYSMWVQR